MSWRDRLLSASFRGVNFLVDNHEYSGGRRLAVHEYPGRDLPFAEDLGEKVREYQIEAFLVGNDYDQNRNLLLAALRKFGPGELIHPYLGHINLQVKTWSITENTDQGGFCTIRINFVDPGIARDPSSFNPKISASQNLDDLVAKAAASSIIDVSEIEQIEGRTFVLNSVRKFLDRPLKLLDYARQGEDFVKDFTAELSAVKNEIETLNKVPSDLANRTLRLWRNLGEVMTVRFSAENTAQINSSRTFNRPSSQSLSAISANSSEVAPPPKLIRVLDNQRQSENLQQVDQLTNYAIIIAQSEVLLRANIAHQNEYHQAIAKYRHQAESAMANAPDPVFQAILSTMEAVSSASYQNLPPLLTHQVSKSIPSTALAQILGAKEDDLLDGNNIAHPLFVTGAINYVRVR